MSRPHAVAQGSRAGPLATRVALATALEAATFAVASVMHLRPGIHLGVTTLRGEWFPHAAIPEAIIATALAVGTISLLAGWPGRWGIAVATHVFAIVGVLVGLGAINAGLGPRTTLDLAYHATILVVLVGVLAVLVRRRAALAG